MAKPKIYSFEVEPNDCLPLSFNVRDTVLNGYSAEFLYSCGSFSNLMTSPNSGVSVSSLNGNIALTLPGSMTALIEGGNSAGYKLTLIEPGGCRRTLIYGNITDASK